MADEVVAEVPVTEEAPKVLTTDEALEQTLKISLASGGVARGAKEAIKALDRGVGKLCLLASDCDKPEIEKLVRALCEARNVPIMLNTRQEIGRMCGQTRVLVETGEVKKIIGCSVAVITKYGRQTDARSMLLQHLASQ
ncbi:MAG: hypothetical protein MHM6MM_005245 [Cercozoa sp. M6MM]